MFRDSLPFTWGHGEDQVKSYFWLTLAYKFSQTQHPARPQQFQFPPINTFPHQTEPPSSDGWICDREVKQRQPGSSSSGRGIWVHPAPPPALSGCLISRGSAAAPEPLWDNGWAGGCPLTALETCGLDFFRALAFSPLTAQLRHCLSNLPVGMCRGYLNQPPPASALYTDWADNCNSWMRIRWAAPASDTQHWGVTMSQSQAPVTSTKPNPRLNLSCKPTDSQEQSWPRLPPVQDYHASLLYYHGNKSDEHL